MEYRKVQVIMTKRAEYNDNIVKQTNIRLCNTMTTHRTGMKSLLYHTGMTVRLTHAVSWTNLTQHPL